MNCRRMEPLFPVPPNPSTADPHCTCNQRHCSSGSRSGQHRGLPGCHTCLQAARPGRCPWACAALLAVSRPWEPWACSSTHPACTRRPAPLLRPNCQGAQRPWLPGISCQNYTPEFRWPNSNVGISHDGSKIEASPCRRGEDENVENRGKIVFPNHLKKSRVECS